MLRSHGISISFDSTPRCENKSGPAIPSGLSSFSSQYWPLVHLVGRAPCSSSSVICQLSFHSWLWRWWNFDDWKLLCSMGFYALNLIITFIEEFSAIHFRNLSLVLTVDINLNKSSTLQIFRNCWTKWKRRKIFMFFVHLQSNITQWSVQVSNLKIWMSRPHNAILFGSQTAHLSLWDDDFSKII